MGGWEDAAIFRAKAERLERIVEVLLNEIDRRGVEIHNLRCEVRNLGGEKVEQPRPL